MRRLLPSKKIYDRSENLLNQSPFVFEKKKRILKNFFSHLPEDLYFVFLLKNIQIRF